ncbi:hypothetical protein EON66_03265 [archaeon]|nr:MAG: hypothetical protein EON66_03265 [archaeon]
MDGFARTSPSSNRVPSYAPFACTSLQMESQCNSTAVEVQASINRLCDAAKLVWAEADRTRLDILRAFGDELPVEGQQDSFNRMSWRMYARIYKCAMLLTPPVRVVCLRARTCLRVCAQVGSR